MARASVGGPLPPGATIGILGGGQLGRMLALSAARLGLKCHIYCPEETQPAFDVSYRHTVAAYEDESSLSDFARDCDVITYESENIPLESLVWLSERKPVRPGVKALGIARDRLLEKNFLRGLAIPTVPFHAVDDRNPLSHAMDRVGLPAILKTRRFGYDGKGQFIIRRIDEAGAALASMNGQEAILERLIHCKKEISVLLARGTDGQTEIYDVPENEHAAQILRHSRVPARILRRTSRQGYRL